MKTVKLNNHGNTKIIAHRGLSGLYLENTMSAFKAAGKESYYGIETDVHITRDGKYIIFHDDTTRRLSKINVEIEKTDYNTLRMIPIKFHRMPSLSEYINCCKNYGKKAVLELKNPMSFDNIEGIIKEIEEHGYIDETIIISFDLQNLKYVRRINNNQNVQYLSDKFNSKVLDILAENKFDLDVKFTCVNADIVELCHNNGIKINCYTVNNPADAERLIDNGVDFITTNILV